MTSADSHKLASEYNSKLQGKLFLGGTKPSKEDIELFNKLFGAENLNLARWIKHIASFSPEEVKAWGNPVKVVPPPLKAPEAPKKAEEPKKEAPKAEEPKKEEPKKEEPKKEEPKKEEPKKEEAEEEEDDLFAEPTEEEKAALEAKKAEAEKKPKKVVIAKSSILMDIKPWDDTIDLEALSAKMRAVEKDGLVWGDHKLVPVAFGVKKLQQLIVIEDDKVSSDDIDEMIVGGFEDEVQSMDIVAWNKI